MAQQPPPGWPEERSPYHAGEIALQTRAGSRDVAERAGRRGIRAAMPDQHRTFFAALPLIVVGGLDGLDRPWASLRSGRPGFVQSPDPRTLRIAAPPLAGDPLADALGEGAPVGLLGLQAETRRRNRANGTVIASDADGLAIRIAQSFGNCAQYIQARTPTMVDGSHGGAPPAVLPEGPRLSPAARALVAATDTLFLATAAAEARAGDAVAGVDVSHRGGRPGFVAVAEQDGHAVLTLPDFAGNGFFNSFGNLAVNPRAGVTVIDYGRGDLLFLTGHATVIWDGPERDAFAGAERLLRFTVESGRRVPGALPLRWSAAEPSPQLAGTGTWGCAAG